MYCVDFTILYFRTPTKIPNWSNGYYQERKVIITTISIILNTPLMRHPKHGIIVTVRFLLTTSSPRASPCRWRRRWIHWRVENSSEEN